MKPRIRLTAATARRVKQMKMLLVELAQRDMTLLDMGDSIGFSRSGARKYVVDLVDAELLTVACLIEAGRYSHGKPLYRLTNDAARIAAFVRSIEMPPGSVEARPSPKQAAQKAEPGRRLHIMGDDVHYAVRLNRSVPARDELVAALFGEARK